MAYLKKLEYKNRKILFTKRQRIAIAVAVLFLAVLVYLIVVNFVKTSTDSSFYPKNIGDIPVITDTLPPNTLGRPGIKRQIKYIVIHETGNTKAGSDAKAHNDYMHKIANEKELSWHYTVDDNKIYHHVPDNEIAWHAGDSKGNKYGVGIEICVNEDGDFDKAFVNAAALTACLLNEYNLKISDVKMHFDFNGKNCPQTIIEQNRWGEFLDDVKKHM